MNTEKGRRFAKVMAASGSASSGPSKGATDWEFWEDLSNQPKWWRGDVCDLKREAEIIVIQCDDLNELGKTCYAGEIEFIQLAIYGFV